MTNPKIGGPSGLSMEPRTQPYRQYGQSVGIVSPIGNENPFDLIGTPDAPGWLIQMRTGYPLITSILDSRRDLIASTKFAFDGPGSEKLNKYFKKDFQWNGQKNSLSEMIASIIDQSTSYGFCLLEHWVGATTGYAYLTDCRTIYEFIPDPEDRYRFEMVRFFNGAGFNIVDRGRLQHFAESQLPGNFWGLSALRPLVQRFTALQADFATYVGRQALSSGIPWISTESGLDVNPDDPSHSSMVDFLTRYLGGQQVSIVAAPGYRVEVSGAPNSNVSADFLAACDSFDEQVRQVLNSNLNTLGLSSVGSKALGETIEINDTEKFEAFLESWLEKIVRSEMIEFICIDLGVEHEGISLTTENRTRETQYDFERLEKLINLGIVTPDQLGEDVRSELLRSVGVEVSLVDETPEEDDVAPEEVVDAVADAMERYSALPVVERPDVAAQVLTRARRIASGVLTKLDRARAASWIRRNVDQRGSLLWDLYGGDAMAAFIGVDL